MDWKAVAWSGLRMALYFPLCCWGLLAFMAFQQWMFNDPIAFARAQQVWRIHPESNDDVKLISLLTLEPVRATYDKASPCYWGNWAPSAEPLFNLPFANPIYFLATLFLVNIGVLRKWISFSEWSLSMLMVIVPYALQAPRMGMISQGRFSAVVFPVYIVMGHILTLAPRVVVIYILACAAMLTVAYSALFTSGFSLL